MKQTTELKDFDELMKGWNNVIEQADKCNPIDAFSALQIISMACVRKAYAHIEDKAAFRDAIRDLLDSGFKSAFPDEADKQQNKQ